MGVDGFSSLTVRYADLISNEKNDEDSEEKSKKIISNIKSVLGKLARKEEHSESSIA